MRSHIAVTVVVSVFASGAALQPGRCTELNGLDFVVTTDKTSYKVGEPVRVSFTWTKVGVVTVKIPKWRGPLAGVTATSHDEGAIRDFSVYYEGKERVGYGGGFSCGMAREISLESKRTLTQSYEINEVYSLTRPGRYVLRSAFFGYPLDDGSLGHWRGRIDAPEVEIWIHE